VTFDVLTQILIFLAAYFGQAFGVLFGGGGFVIHPALLALGVTPKLVIANTIVATACSMYAFLLTTKRKVPIAKTVVPLMVPSLFIGAILGSHALSVIPEHFVKWIILTACSLGFIYVLTHLKKRKKEASDQQELLPVRHWKIILPLAGLALGFYDGFIAAGGGTIIIMVLTLVIRQDMKSTIYMAVCLGAFSLTTAGIMHGLKGYLEPSLLALMIPACIISGFTGAKLTEIIPEKSLRLMYGATITCLLIYLIYDSFSV